MLEFCATPSGFINLSIWRQNILCKGPQDTVTIPIQSWPYLFLLENHMKLPMYFNCCYRMENEETKYIFKCCIFYEIHILYTLVQALKQMWHGDLSWFQQSEAHAGYVWMFCSFLWNCYPGQAHLESVVSCHVVWTSLNCIEHLYLIS